MVANDGSVFWPANKYGKVDGEAGQGVLGGPPLAKTMSSLSFYWPVMAGSAPAARAPSLAAAKAHAWPSRGRCISRHCCGVRIRFVGSPKV